jgi:PKD domain
MHRAPIAGAPRAFSRARFAALGIAIVLIVPLLVTTSGARAVVVDMNALGQSQVAYNPVDQSGYYGVALVPGSRAQLTTAGVPTVTSSGQCSDPWLSLDLGGPNLPPTGLCWHGGGGTPGNAVIHANETFAITWDPARTYWATTRDYVEQFLRDVADGSGTLTSPFALTPQYSDFGGRAANASRYGGGCIDYGTVGGSACQFGNTIGTGPGKNYPSTSSCPLTGANLNCLTDADVRSELTTMVANMGLVGRTQANYTPLLVLLTPQNVQVCLDSDGALCSANGTSTAKFCSYHSHIWVGGANFTYVVQPWTTYSGCDEGHLPALPAHPTARQVAIDAGTRLVNPLSQGHIAAIVNPWLNAWFASDGSEINDNGQCGPDGDPYDQVIVGRSSQNPYDLQPEFNNAGAIEIDPNALQCELGVTLAPTFVVPSPIDHGDVVAFDGSVTDSTLIVPGANYRWNFGDGTTSIGPSVVHSYANGGTYTVTLSVTDRGGNMSTFSQPIVVLGPSAKPGNPPPSKQPNPGMTVRLELIPQGLRAMLRAGLALRITSSANGDGIVTLSITRAAARRAQIRTGSGPAVVVARGTISQIKSGTATVHLHLSGLMVTKLRRLRHVTLTVRLALFAAQGRHIAVDVAGQYR